MNAKIPEILAQMSYKDVVTSIIEFSLLALFIGFTVLTTGCAQSTDEELKQVVKSHVAAQTSAQNLNKCRDLFNKEAARTKSESTTLCEALEKLNDRDLSVCEDEILDTKFSYLIKSCKTKLLKSLNEIKLERNDGMEPSEATLGFKLPFEIQKRDLTNGYTASTGDTQDKQVILSFDDGPHPLSKQVVAILQSVGVRAHFFPVGKNVLKYPEITKLIASKGHSVGNHSWDHSDFTTLSFSQQMKQVYDTNKIIVQTIGWVDPFFRFPYGAKTSQLSQFLKKHQAANFHWSIDSNDWKKINSDGTVRTNLQVIQETLAQLDEKGRGLVLFHDVHARTVELLPAFLTALYKKGYKVVLLKATNSHLENNPLLP